MTTENIANLVLYSLTGITFIFGAIGAYKIVNDLHKKDRGKTNYKIAYDNFINNEYKELLSELKELGVEDMYAATILISSFQYGWIASGVETKLIKSATSNQ